MKVNDVLRRGGVTLRILAIRSNLVFCINCNASCMPAWISAEELEGCNYDAAPVIDWSAELSE